MIFMDTASRISSVLGLKAKPKIAMRLPSKSPKAFLASSTALCG